MKWALKEKRCFSCQTRLDSSKVVQVSFKPKSNIHNVPSILTSELLIEINKFKMQSSFGTKMDMIVKHIAYLLKENPSVKVLCFSQWDAVLKILGDALQTQKIGYLSLEGKGWDPVESKSLSISKKGASVTKFIKSESITCFMLHAKSQSSGLTLVEATHVFLIEPMLQKGLEQQAVGRVHRIGLSGFLF